MKSTFVAIIFSFILASCAGQIGTRYPASIDAPNEKRKIVVAIDGTGNDQYSRTNVARLYELIDNQNQGSISTFYTEGVGTDHRIIGAATGQGMADDVRNAYQFLAEEWEPNDEIYLIGFSRGAYSVRVLGGMLAIAGIADLKAVQKNKRKKLIKSIYSAYKTKRQPDENIFKHNERRADRLSEIRDYRPKASGRDVPIEAMIIWDTVEALGVPDRTDRTTENLSQYFINTCNVRSVYHALALDDNRAYSFTPISATTESMTKACPKYRPRVEEVWFSGAHADVGGTYAPNSRIDGFLPGVSLNWIISRLKKNHSGIVPASASVFADEFGPIHDAKAYSFAYKPLGLRWRRPFRDALESSDYYGKRPKVHMSVKRRLSKLFKLDDEFAYCNGDGSKILLLCSNLIKKMPFVDNGLRLSQDQRCFVQSLSRDGELIGYDLRLDAECITLISNDTHSSPPAGEFWLNQ